MSEISWTIKIGTKKRTMKRKNVLQKNFLSTIHNAKRHFPRALGLTLLFVLIVYNFQSVTTRPTDPPPSSTTSVFPTPPLPLPNQLRERQPQQQQQRRENNINNNSDYNNTTTESEREVKLFPAADQTNFPVSPEQGEHHRVNLSETTKNNNYANVVSISKSENGDLPIKIASNFSEAHETERENGADPKLMPNSKSGPINNSTFSNKISINTDLNALNSTASSTPLSMHSTRNLSKTSISYGAWRVPDSGEKGGAEVEVVEACDESNSKNSFIYCYGKLLDAVNTHSIFDDSKTFVDRPLKRSAEEVLQKFEEEFSAKTPERLDLVRFVEENFEQEGHELMTCELNDWNETPPLLGTIRDQTLREWAHDLNRIWRKLCRQITPDVLNNPDRHSLLYVPKSFVVPGGRFREFYYWDAYWIIKGLLVSGMVETAKNMIENFLFMVETYGFIPNGGRVYYLRRSQPPLLVGMVYEYYEATHDLEFIRKALPLLEKELNFWEVNRQVDVNIRGSTHKVFQYRAGSNVPRPESYREDKQLVKQITKPSEKHRIWRDVATAAESGWDFSSRWMQDPTNPDLRTIETTNIVQVDLNAFICWNYDILSYFFLELNNETKANEYRDKHYQFRSTFRKVFYVPDPKGNKAYWYDYNLRTGEHNAQFYPSLAVPLFTRCYRGINMAQAQLIFRAMDDFGVFEQPGGIPSSLIKNSTQQWDWPNGWPPSNHMIIEGLRRSGNPLMQQKAFWLAEKWVLANYRVYKNTHFSMWEKYNVIGIYPELGSGGEYDVQAGFGWTNGVILDLLATYGDRMYFHKLDEDPNAVARKVINTEPKFVQKDEHNNIDHNGNAAHDDEAHRRAEIVEAGVIIPSSLHLKDDVNGAVAINRHSIITGILLAHSLLLLIRILFQ